MGETLGIAHNVFEKAERERDRKQRLKALEDWQKEKSARMKRASIYGKSTGNKPGTTTFTSTTTTTSLGSSNSSTTAEKSGGKMLQRQSSSSTSSHKDLRHVQEKSSAVQRDHELLEDDEKESIESNESKNESTCMCVIL